MPQLSKGLLGACSALVSIICILCAYGAWHTDIVTRTIVFDFLVLCALLSALGLLVLLELLLGVRAQNHRGH